MNDYDPTDLEKETMVKLSEVYSEQVEKAESEEELMEVFGTVCAFHELTHREMEEAVARKLNKELTVDILGP
jgi:hypothetical protein